MSAGKPCLLLHICCGPCATAVVERLRERFELLGYWFNPNIHPEEEHERRLGSARRFAAEAGLELVVEPYDAAPWHEAVRGLEAEPEGGSRCQVCYRLRAERTAEEAARRGIPQFAVTLTVSPHKRAEVINPIGQAAAAAHGVAFLAEDFKKQGGFDRSRELSHQQRLYRQSYCGCLYSRRL